MKIPAAKAAVDEEWEKLEKIPAWDLTKVWSKSEVIDEARTKGVKVHFASLMGTCHLKKCCIGDKGPKIQRSSCIPRWYYKRRFWILCSIYRTRFISITNDSSKSHGYHLQTARLRRTSSWRSICLNSGKNGGCTQIIENSKIGMSRHLDSSTTTQMAKIMVQYGRPSRSSWAKPVWSSFGRTIVGKAIWENPIEVRLGEGFQLGMLIRTPRKRIILFCVCGWHPLGWKETKHWSDVESTQQREPTSFLDHVFLGCTQRQCEISKHIVDNYRNMFESRISAGATEKLPCSEIFEFLRGPTIWRVMPRNVWNDIVSWRTKRLNNSAKYQLHALMTIISKKKNWNPWEDCRKYAFKLFWNAFSWHVLEDLIFHGQRINLHDRLQNGPKLVTNDYLVWSLTFIIHVNMNSITMWETLPNSADWDCFKTPILQEILRIQNLDQVEHCAFLEVIRLCQSVGCVRNKLQFRTVQQNQKSFPWTQDWGWTVYPYLIYSIWSSQFFTETRIREIKHGETCVRTYVRFVQYLTHFKNERNLMELLMIWTMLILFPQTSNLLVRKLCCISLKTAKQWSRWS